ncbi:LysM peptidoglycan-binding domain-containing protein [Pseudoalteromonas sp. SG41-1]|uniref:LysM peptidoglycan-binding domain-containing protein n=1 Tax=Pseudoalteromonas sp. SG41-1 TaxID=2760979 RepID=UPI001C723374|nr:LysM peptidoglycan-binding domain-containing protein [Pseudoalteromonas sp. SG41-1]
MSKENIKDEEYKFEFDESVDNEDLDFDLEESFETDDLDDFDLDEKPDADIAEVIEPVNGASISEKDREEIKKEVVALKTSLNEYYEKIEEAIKNGEELKVSEEMKEQADIIRKQFITPVNENDVEQAKKAAYQIGLSPNTTPVPFYQFEKELRGEYFKGAKERKQITEVHKEYDYISQYTIKSTERELFNQLQERYKHSREFQEFALRQLVINEYAKTTGFKDNEKRTQYLTDEGYVEFMKRPEAKQAEDNVKTVLNTKFPPSLQLEEQIQLLTAKSLKNEKGLTYIQNTFQRLNKSRYEKHVEKVNQLEENNSLQEERIKNALDNHPNAFVERMLPIDKNDSVDAQLRRLTNSENPNFIDAGFPENGLGYGDVIPLSDYGYIIPASSDNKLKNSVVIIHSSKDIAHRELLKGIGGLEGIKHDTLILPTDNPENIDYKARENATVHDINGTYIKLFKSPVNNVEDQDKVYYQEITKAQYQELVKSQTKEQVNDNNLEQVKETAEIKYLPVVDKRHEKNMNNIETLMTRLIVIEEAIQKDKEDFERYRNQINRRKDISKEQKAALIDTFKDDIFEPERDIYNQFKLETLEINTLRLRGDAVNDFQKQRLEWLEEQHKNGLDAYIAEQYVKNERYYNQVAKRHPDIVKNVRDKIDNSIDKTNTDKHEARAQATLTVFGRKHKINPKSLIKHFINKEHLKKGALTSLKAASAVINPVGFAVSQGISKLIMSDKLKPFREKVSERISNSLDYLGAKQGTKARKYLATGAVIVGAVGLGAYTLMTGDMETAQIAYGKVEENIKEFGEGIANNVKEFVKPENIAAIKANLYDGINTAKEAVERGLSSPDFSNNVYATELPVENNAVDNSVVNDTSSTPTVEKQVNDTTPPVEEPVKDIPEVQPDFIPAEARIDFTGIEIEQAEAFTNDLFNGVDENQLDKALNQISGVSVEDLKQHVQANIEKQIANGTFPTEIKLDINAEDWKGRVQTIETLNFTQDNLYETANGLGVEQAQITVSQGDTLSEIAESYLGNNATPENIEAMVNKIAEMNSIEDPNLIFPDQKLSMPNPNQLLASNTWTPEHLTNDTSMVANTVVNELVETTQPTNSVKPVSLADMYNDELVATDTLNKDLAQSLIDSGAVLPERREFLETYIQDVIDNHMLLNNGNLTSTEFKTDINNVVLAAQEPNITREEYIATDNQKFRRKSMSMSI